MLLELPLINRLEVAWQALSLDRVGLWYVHLDFLRTVCIDEAEILECLRVGRREVEVRWDVATQLQVLRLRVRVKQVLHATQLTSLSLSEILFVSGTSVEGQRVVWVLRVSFVEDIVLTVVPVRESG